MKNILVTGATGFIGNHVIKALLKKDVEVVATSSNTEKAQRFSWYSSVKFIPFNFDELDDSIDYYSFFQQPDIVIHLAWPGLPNYNQPFHVEKNYPLQLSFVKNLMRNGLKDITITGTCFEYGMQGGCLSEEMETKPDNYYAKAKDMLRIDIEKLHAEFEFSMKWVRLFYMYGEGQNPNSLLSQLDKALAAGDEVFNMSGGEQERDYLPVEEVAENIVKIALQQKIAGIVNCCSGVPVKVKDLVKDYLVKKQAHIQLNLGFYPYPTYEPMHFWGDNKKLKSILNNEQSN